MSDSSGLIVDGFNNRYNASRSGTSRKAASTDCQTRNGGRVGIKALAANTLVWFYQTLLSSKVLTTWSAYVEVEVELGTAGKRSEQRQIGCSFQKKLVSYLTDTF